MSAAGVTASDVKQADDAAGNPGCGAICTWALLFVLWCCLLLGLHWCAFCSGVKADGELQNLERQTPTLMQMQPQMPMQPMGVAGQYPPPQDPFAYAGKAPDVP